MDLCGILSDVYIARKRNFRGQVYGFLRFLHVKNSDKLAMALNNVWIGQHRIWAREARFDRFAYVSSEVGARKGKKVEVSPVVRVTGKGIYNVRVGREDEVLRGEGENSKIEVKYEVRAGGVERQSKLRRVEEGLEGKKVVVKEEGAEGVVKVKAVGQHYTKSDKKVQLAAHGTVVCQCVKKESEVTRFIPSYKSTVEDRNWADKGMVATVYGGDSTLALQQRIEDAGFNTVVVTPMGGNRVFLYWTGGEDIWHVFNNAIHFFGMLFYNLHKWSLEEAHYERGAWLRIYGVPVQAWNVSFFKLCVMDIGRFVRVDDCTDDKARLDFARVLITTPQLDIVNAALEFFIDSINHSVKMVEEWGCNLGEDAFLTEVNSESQSDAPQHLADDHGLEEVSGEWELDELVDDLQEEWSKHEGKNKENLSSKIDSAAGRFPKGNIKHSCLAL